MKKIYNWGINPFYFIAGQKNIHPSYIQEMMQDNSYNEEDILGVIETLNLKFNLRTDPRKYPYIHCIFLHQSHLQLLQIIPLQILMIVQESHLQ